MDRSCKENPAISNQLLANQPKTITTWCSRVIGKSHSKGDSLLLRHQPDNTRGHGHCAHGVEGEAMLLMDAGSKRDGVLFVEHLNMEEILVQRYLLDVRRTYQNARIVVENIGERIAYK